MNERNRTLAACALATTVAWTALGAADPMDDYYRICSGPLASMDTMPACEALAARLEAIGSPSREEWLAGLRARNVADNDSAAFCAGLGRHLEVHPDHPEALRDRAIPCTDDFDERIALLLRALEIEPGNYNALDSLLFFAWYSGEDMGVDPEALAVHRAMLYEVAKARSAEWAAEFPPDFSSARVLQELFGAARYIVDEAVRAGDPGAAAAIRDRVRRDAGLDSLGFGGDEPCAGWEDCPRGGRGDSLHLACLPRLFSIGLEDVCVSALETLAGSAGSSGTAVPDDVLRAAESAAAGLRGKACAVLHGGRPSAAGGNRALDGRCLGLATESPAVARLRAALEDHRGVWSSEHHRVHAQGFLGDAARLEGLRRILRVDPGNERAKCDLAAALAARGRSAEAAGVLGDGDPGCLADADTLGRGFAWGDRDDYAAWQERQRTDPSVSEADRLRTAHYLKLAEDAGPLPSPD